MIGPTPERRRILYIVSHPITARVLLRGQLAWLRESGFDVTVVASPGPDLEATAARERVTCIGVRIEREAAPIADLRALLRLVSIISEIRPHVVNASTPKAGLLGMTASRIARVPVRIYLLRGLRLETTTGVKRMILGVAERLTAALATRVIAVSPSLRRAFVDAGLGNERKVAVLGAGSSNGFDLERYAVTEARVVEAAALRARLGIAPDEVVIGFVGRFVEDKGISVALDVFDRLSAGRPLLRLMLVGGSFAGDRLSASVSARIRDSRGIINVGVVDEVAPYYRAMQVFAFPSLREGFPNAPLEAAAAGVPTVGFRVTGLVDAVENGFTGTLVDPGDVAGFARAVADYVDNPDLRAEHGESAAQRASDFANQVVWDAWLEEYARLVGLPAGELGRAHGQD